MGAFEAISVSQTLDKTYYKSVLHDCWALKISMNEIKSIVAYYEQREIR